MEKMEMVEKLIAKANITMEEAKDILERNEWDLLNATIEGKELGKDVFNKTMGKASEATSEFVTNLAEKKPEEITEE